MGQHWRYWLHRIDASLEQRQDQGAHNNFSENNLL